MCAVMLWEIWKERCNVRYGNKLGQLKNISWRVMAWIRDFRFLLGMCKCKNEKEVIILRGLNIHSVDVQIQRNIIVRWGKPPLGCLKLNVDGAAKGNPRRTGGGGIIRDHNGDVIAGFSKFYGITTNMVAEFNAIRDGLLLCSDLSIGLSTVLIESDSLILVEMFNKGCCSLWQLQNQWNEVLCNVKQVRAVQHQFREANAVADCLANVGISKQQSLVFGSFQDLPSVDTPF